MAFMISQTPTSPSYFMVRQYFNSLSTHQAASASCICHFHALFAWLSDMASDFQAGLGAFPMFPQQPRLYVRHGHYCTVFLSELRNCLLHYAVI